MLGIHPSCYITFAFILCALIPNFPMIVVFFYPFCILPQLMMGKNQENNDFEYSTLLPLSLKDYVKGKVVVLALFELVSYCRCFCLEIMFSLTIPLLQSII